MNIRNYIYLSLVLFSLTIVSCSTEDLDPTLAQQKVVEGSITKDTDMFSVLKGGLNRFTGSTYYGRDFIINGEIRTDNTFANGSSGRFQTQNFYDYTASNDPGCWSDAYRVIAVANILINIDLGTISGDPDYAKHVQGQAYFLRALSTFDLMKNYGQQYLTNGNDLGVALITEFKTGDPLPSRATVAAAKQFIYDDLDLAFSYMDDSYNVSTEYPTKMAAKALESSVGTYFGDWARVKTASEAVIGSGKYTVLDGASFVSSFGVDNSANSIFELAFSDVDNVGINGLGYIYRGSNYGDVEVVSTIKDMFEATDVRGLNLDADGVPHGILGYEGTKLRNIGKFPSLNGYDNVPVLRIEEIILNYAEALVELGQGNPSAELNKITSKRGATAYGASVTRDDVLMERRKELMFEGKYFDDLVRSGKTLPKMSANVVVENLAPGNNLSAFAIPIAEMDANSNMVQNPGYN